jgi:hypothetical protein
MVVMPSGFLATHEAAQLGDIDEGGASFADVHRFEDERILSGAPTGGDEPAAAGVCYWAALARCQKFDVFRRSLGRVFSHG